MSTIHFKATTTSTPEQFVAGLTDFGPGRSKLFGNSADSDYVAVREGKNLQGRALSIALGTVGKGVLKTAFEKAVRAIEARNDDAKTPALS
jgi:hypothetical protein